MLSFINFKNLLFIETLLHQRLGPGHDTARPCYLLFTRNRHLSNYNAKGWIVSIAHLLLELRGTSV